MSDPAIAISGLSKRYLVKPDKKRAAAAGRVLAADGSVIRRRNPRPREVWALRDLDLEVASGSVLGIIGPNGAGKSTLLKILARVTPPTAGRAVVRGRIVSLLELGAGFQPEFSGRENILLNAAMYGVARSEALERMDNIVAFAELEDAIDTPVKRYSSGMYLRLAFSVAINMEPDILLADEVLAVGDMAFQERCLQRVERAGEEGLTVLFVSHDMAAISRLCDRVVLLRNGIIEHDGEPAEAILAYERSALADGGHEVRGGTRDETTWYGELLDVGLRSAAGSQVGALRTSEPTDIEIVMRTFVGDVSITGTLALSTQGVVAFRSAAQAPYVAQDPGLHRLLVRIPPDLLADTTYVVKVGVAMQREGRQKTLVRDNALSFRVYDEVTGGPLGPYHGAVDGVVRPRLEWQGERVAEQPPMTRT
jgi:lipopolysaccharide transport system ATP-binding protein